MRDIDFDKEFIKGSSSFEGFLSNWWIQKSNDAAHRRAYRNIADRMHLTLAKAGISPRFMVDYACGNGAILKTLAKLFPSTNIVALDGSKKMLSMANAVLDDAGLDSKFVSARDSFASGNVPIRLLQTPLPDLCLPYGKADIVLFLFPNITISSRERRLIRRQTKLDEYTHKTARFLAKLNQDDSGALPEATFEELLDCRAISGNIHQLLKKGGFWFEVEYANAPRDEWEEVDQITTLFEESAWDVSIGKAKLQQKFRLLESWFYKSSVMLDVYEQSGDPEDRYGGYVISILQAL